MRAPPSITVTSRLLTRCIAVTDGWTRRRRIAVTGSAFLLLAGLQWLGDPAINLNVFYMFACALALWCLGGVGGMAMGAGGAVLSTIIKHGQLPIILAAHHVSPLLELWNFVSRVSSFALLALLVNGLRGVLAQEQWRGAHDGLTGALNKGAFEREMEQAVAHAQAAGQQLLVAYMDLDGFKALNDQHGHAAGDRVLALFVSAAKRAIRAGDLLARIGGDEFALLLPLPPAVDAARVAQLLHHRLSAILAASGLPVTCSMGAVVVPGGAVTRDAVMLEQADALMYDAKRAGKNGLRVACAGAFGTVAAALRTAYPIAGDDADRELAALLAWVDVADTHQRRRFADAA